MWQILQHGIAGAAAYVVDAASLFLSRLTSLDTYMPWLLVLGGAVVVDLPYRLAVRPASEPFWSCPSLRRIYTHRSTALDLKYILFKIVCMQSFAVSRVGIGVLGAGALTLVWGPGPKWSVGSVDGIAFTLLTMFLVDVGYYTAHYLLHRVPALWQLHKVHHAAEVLTPATASRIHPGETLLIAMCEMPMHFVAIGVFFYLYGDTSSMAVYAGANLVYLLDHALAGFRHSQVWLSFGPMLEHIFSSPAQHQIHHSAAPRHLDKNFCRNFSIIDWAFGTLYVPKQEEQLEFGLHEGHDPELETLRGTLWIPLKRIYSMLIPTKSRPEAGITLLDCSDCDARALQENR